MNLAALMNAESLVATWGSTGEIDLRSFGPDLPEAGCGLTTTGGGKSKCLTVNWERAREMAHKVA